MSFETRPNPAAAGRPTGSAVARWLPAMLAALIVCGCGSGSGGSEVGAHAGSAPTARPQILNGSTSGAFRAGAEVLLTGKASEDPDGPLLDWNWRQTAGPSVKLVEANSNTVSFTAPDVSAATTLSFSLDVVDSSGATGSATIDVEVVPARDANKFLSLDVRTGPSFDEFKLVAALRGGAKTGETPKPFTLSARAYLVYPPRSAPDADCRFDPADFAAGLPATLASGCLVELLEDLTPMPTPDGTTGIRSEWPAGVDAPDEPLEARFARWWNPRFRLKIPRLDVRDFNQRWVDSGQRDRLLDPFAADAARIVLQLSLSAPQNQSDASMILSDSSDRLVSLPDAILVAPSSDGSIDNDGTGRPTSAIVPVETLSASIEGRESALTAEVYYRTVDPNATRKTFNAWLQQAGFTSDAKGTLLPEARAGTGEFAHAVYLNNFDLGFGRDMYTRTDEFGNVFSFVRNYSTLEAAIRELGSFVTVVMEYSPLLNHSDSTPKLVKFFTYVDEGTGDERRVSSFNFDGRGERFTPGNCIACHGGARPPGVSELVFDSACGDSSDPACYTWPAKNRDGIDITQGNLDAMYLPWDLDSLLYADTDPAITEAPLPFDGVSLSAELRRDYGDHSRSNEESQLKKLNQAAYSTYQDVARTGAARALLENWYGGVDGAGALVGSYDDSTAVPGWRNDEVLMGGRNGQQILTNPSDAENVYHEVYARHCRMCHTNMLNETFRFDSYQKFIAQRSLIQQTVFSTGLMPGARQTMDRLWVPFLGGTSSGTVLAEHLAALVGEDPPTAPGPATANIAQLRYPPIRGDEVRFDGSGSVFADSYAWTLESPTGSAAKLTGAATSEPAFAVDVPGTYTATVTVNPGTGNEATSTMSFEVSNQGPTAWNDLFELVLPQTVVGGSVLAGPGADTDPEQDPLTVTLSTPPAYGDVVLQPDGSFTYTYRGDPTAPPAYDAFAYQISDGFGGVDGAVAVISFVVGSDASPPTAPTLLTAEDTSVEAGDDSLFRVTLEWSASTDDRQVVGYNVYRDGNFLEFTPADPGAGTTATYQDTSAAPDTTYVYTVTAFDGQNQSAPSNQATATVVPSLRRNIQTGWGSTGRDTLWSVSGCVGCHAAGAGGLTLTGSAADVYAELNEDSADPPPRRLERDAPESSLLLCKPLALDEPNSCKHGGGDRLNADDPQYQLLLRWIERGAPNN